MTYELFDILLQLVLRLMNLTFTYEAHGSVINGNQGRLEGSRCDDIRQPSLDLVQPRVAVCVSTLDIRGGKQSLSN